MIELIPKETLPFEMSEQLPYWQKLAMIKNKVLPKETGAKQKRPLKKISDKRKIEMTAEKTRLGGNDSDLVRFYKGAMKVMGDHCLWCGKRVENRIYSHAVFSICHLLDKRKTVCPSVKCHPANFVTLCPDHHTMFDRMNWIEREQLGFWEIVRDRLVMVYPSIDPGERRHFPTSVMNYMIKMDKINSIG